MSAARNVTATFASKPFNLHCSLEFATATLMPSGAPAGSIDDVVVEI